MPQKTDFLIIGAGIVGLTISLELKKKFPDASVTLIEKEKTLAEHGSGRNSGVLHAGFYYTSDSLKARFCRDGNALLTEFCEEYNLPIRKCGKLVAAKNEDDLEGLEILLNRGKTNGVQVEKITEDETKEIEPQVRTFKYALWSPNTSTIDPVSLMQKLLEKAKESQIDIHFGEKYISKVNGIIRTNKQEYAAGYLVNAAGLYADKIAHDFGHAQELCILPFKGLYLYRNIEGSPINTHIYPVPDLNYPFLGVHFTVTVDEKTKIGPTAIPAFWRENYNGFQNFRLGEFLQTVGNEASLMLNSNFDFKNLAINEMRKKFKAVLVSQAKALIHNLNKNEFKKWGKPGIRAQLYDTQEKKLIMDFAVQGDSNSFHVLNAVSPALTASMPFAAYCCEKIDNLC